jgi:hypothetical protein
VNPERRRILEEPRGLRRRCWKPIGEVAGKRKVENKSEFVTFKEVADAKSSMEMLDSGGDVRDRADGGMRFDPENAFGGTDGFRKTIRRGAKGRA